MSSDIGAHSDPWALGTLDRKGLWATYAFVNLPSALVNLVVLRAIVKLKDKKNSGDVFIASLCLGCMLMSIPCGMQCLLNLIADHNRFDYGWFACQFEAFAHISAIMLQFFSVSLIAWRHFVTIRGTNVSVDRSLMIMFGTIALAVGGTFLTGHWSEVYLMPAGAYCFPKFNSPTIIFWFCPIMVLSLFATIFFYGKIFFDSRALLAVAERNMQAREAWSRNTSNISLRIAKWSVTYVVIFFVGWFPAVVATFWEYTAGEINQELDTTIGVMGSLHSLVVPLVYGFNPRLRGIVFCGLFGRPQIDQDEQNSSIGSSASTTMHGGVKSSLQHHTRASEVAILSPTAAASPSHHGAPGVPFYTQNPALAAAGLGLVQQRDGSVIVGKVWHSPMQQPHVALAAQYPQYPQLAAGAQANGHAHGHAHGHVMMTTLPHFFPNGADEKQIASPMAEGGVVANGKRSPSSSMGYLVSRIEKNSFSDDHEDEHSGLRSVSRSMARHAAEDNEVAAILSRINALGAQPQPPQQQQTSVAVVTQQQQQQQSQQQRSGTADTTITVTSVTSAGALATATTTDTDSTGSLGERRPGSQTPLIDLNASTPSGSPPPTTRLIVNVIAPTPVADADDSPALSNARNDFTRHSLPGASE